MVSDENTRAVPKTTKLICATTCSLYPTSLVILHHVEHKTHPVYALKNQSYIDIMLGIINKITRRFSVPSIISTTSSRSTCGSTTARKSAEDSIGTKTIDSQKYCLEHVRKYDRENYLAAICINDARTRRAVFALRAFNVELSLIRDSTTNSDRAKLRFHFWSKLVEEIIRRNDEQDSNIDKLNAYYNYTPLAKELLDLFYLVDMDVKVKTCLKDLIGARVSSKVLGYKQFETVKELELYCSKSNASIYHLSAELSCQLNNFWNTAKDIKEAMNYGAESLGVAHGLSNIIRGIPYNSTKNCCYIPKDLLERHQLTTRDFTNNKLDGHKVRPVVEELAISCQMSVSDFYRHTLHIPNFFKQLFLPRVAIQTNLRKLKKCNYNICDPSLRLKNGLLPLNLWMASKYFRAPIL